MPSRPKRWKYRILYVGLDYALTAFLKVTFNRLDCFVVRCPSGRLSYCLIESEIKYSLLLFDEQLLDMTGKELAEFARAVKHRKQIPILIVEKSDDLSVLASEIVRLLG
jgi:DNA-binding response OmpR family regulator